MEGGGKSRDGVLLSPWILWSLLRFFFQKLLSNKGIYDKIMKKVRTDMTPCERKKGQNGKFLYQLRKGISA